MSADNNMYTILKESIVFRISLWGSLFVLAAIFAAESNGYGMWLCIASRLALVLIFIYGLFWINKRLYAHIENKRYARGKMAISLLGMLLILVILMGSILPTFMSPLASARSNGAVRGKGHQGHSTPSTLPKAASDHNNPLDPLMIACWKGYDLEEIDPIIHHTTHINSTDAYGRTALMFAAWHNPHPQVIKALLTANADLHQRDHKGTTPLMLASRYNSNEQIANALIKAGAHVNVTNKHGETALILAAGYNNVNVVNALLESGARVNMQDNSGITALMAAAGGNTSPAVLQALIHAGANLNKKNKKGGTALIYAVAHKANDSIIRILLDAGTKVTERASKGTTILMIAAVKNADASTIKALVAHGANVNAKNDDGYTALDLARAAHNKEAVKALVQLGASDVPFKSRDRSIQKS